MADQKEAISTPNCAEKYDADDLQPNKALVQAVTLPRILHYLDKSAQGQDHQHANGYLKEREYDI